MLRTPMAEASTQTAMTLRPSTWTAPRSARTMRGRAAAASISMRPRTSTSISRTMRPLTRTSPWTPPAESASTARTSTLSLATRLARCLTTRHLNQDMRVEESLPAALRRRLTKALSRASTSRTTTRRVTAAAYGLARSGRRSSTASSLATPPGKTVAVSMSTTTTTALRAAPSPATTATSRGRTTRAAASS